MKQLVDLGVGQVSATRRPVALRTPALGSCIAVVVYSAGKGIGGMAHVMLPGRAPSSAAEKTRYAVEAIEELLERMARLGAGSDRIEAVVAGGANVLASGDDTICHKNIDSVRRTLEARGIVIRAAALGGLCRRSVSMDVTEGRVWCTEGDGQARLLWSWHQRTSHTTGQKGQPHAYFRADGLCGGR